MRKKQELDHDSNVKAERFGITWPEKLEAIQPLFRVPVSKTREALVYHDSEAHSVNGVGIVQENGYKVVYVITKTGNQPRHDGDGYYNRELGEFYRSLLDVKLAIQKYSVGVQPKTKTVTTKEKVQVFGDDEDE